MVLRGQDAWRRHPVFTWKFVDVFPGLREGAAAFGVYLAAEWAYGKMYPAPAAHHAGAHHGGAAGDAKPHH